MYLFWLFFSCFPVFGGILCGSLQLIRWRRWTDTDELQHTSTAEWSVVDGGILCAVV